MQHPVVIIQLQAIVCRTSALILYKNITMYSEEYQHIKPFCYCDKHVFQFGDEES